MREAESAFCSMAEEDELDERANSWVVELRGRVVSQRFLAAEVWKGNGRKRCHRGEKGEERRTDPLTDP